MGLLDKLLKGKAVTEEELGAHADGHVIPNAEISDPTFAQELLGKSLAIKPEQGVLKSPANGEMTVVFETGHAVAMRTESGADILLHIGVDTVTLNGEGFTPKVAVGDRVKKGDVLVEFDLDFVVERGLDPVIPMILTNSDEFETSVIAAPGAIQAGSPIMQVKRL